MSTSVPYPTVAYFAPRAVNVDQYEQHVTPLMQQGQNYPLEQHDLRLATDPQQQLYAFYWYWSEGDARGQWPDSALPQDMDVYLDPQTAHQADGASATEVLAALRARCIELEHDASRVSLWRDYDRAVRSLARALQSAGPQA